MINTMDQKKINFYFYQLLSQIVKMKKSSKINKILKTENDNVSGRF
jgi:hypothetical protein